jgi:hypothetical protein
MKETTMLSKARSKKIIGFVVWRVTLNKHEQQAHRMRGSSLVNSLRTQYKGRL